jgi:pimeloyl-ACP methyl ester carboxylesterase
MWPRVSQFATREQRDRTIGLFVHMGRDEGFMRATAEKIRSRLGDKPVLLLYGQFDPMRLIGAVSRFKRMFRRAEPAIIPLEEHFPILASGGRVADVVDRWIGSLERPAAAEVVS